MAECRGQRLPKYTVEVARLFDAPRGAEGVNAWRAMHAALSKVYDAEWLAGELDGHRIDEVDLVELRRLYDETRGAYGAGERESSARTMSEALAVLDSVPIERLQAVGEAVRAIYDADSRARGFGRVV